MFLPLRHDAQSNCSVTTHPWEKKKIMIIINKIKVSLDRDSAGHLMGGHETEAKFVNTGTEQEFQGDANHFSIALTAVSPSMRCNFF